MHTHGNSGASRRLILSLGLTSLVLVAEVIGGIWTGSLALLSDAGHVFMDIFALALSYLALRLSSRPANDQHSYGYHRLEVLAALTNGLSLAVIAVVIWSEAIQRFQTPQDIRSLEMMIIAAIGLVVNLVVAFVLGGHSHTHAPGEEHHHEDKNTPQRQDLNLRSAYLHVLGDAISSVGVILAGILVTFTGWQWVDPLVSVLIGALILVSAYRVTRSSLHILIEGTPEGLSVEEVSAAMRQVPGVRQVHDLHVWSICSGNIALSAHILADTEAGPPPLSGLQEVLHQRFGIHHTTIQVDDEGQTYCGGCE